MGCCCCARLRTPDAFTARQLLFLARLPEDIAHVMAHVAQTHGLRSADSVLDFWVRELSDADGHPPDELELWEMLAGRVSVGGMHDYALTTILVAAQWEKSTLDAQR